MIYRLIDIMDVFKNCLDSPLVVCGWAALIVVLLLVIVYFLSKAGSEHYTGIGLGHGGGYSGETSGATLRTLGQEFSGTNQEDRVTLSNAEVASVAPSLSMVGRPIDLYGKLSTERLVNERGMPDFWEISSELDAYKTSQAPGMQAAAPKPALPAQASATAEQRREHMRGPVSAFEDDALSSLLLR